MVRKKKNTNIKKVKSSKNNINKKNDNSNKKVNIKDKNIKKLNENNIELNKDKVKNEKIVNKDDKNYVKKYMFNKKKLIRFFLILLLLSVFIFSVTKLILNQIDIINNKKDSKKLINEVIKLPNQDKDDNLEEKPDEIKVMNPEEVRVDFGKLKATNSDTVGWMMFNNMLINNPVVHTSDNEYYLNHNFYKKNSDIGTIFMDHRNNSFEDRNVVLFGHATIDDSMFGSLSDVFNAGFFNRENADIIYFYDVNNNLLKYQIFSYYIIESEEYYITTNFRNDEEFQKFINIIKERSLGYRNIGVNVSDKILTLSTCAGSRGTNKRRVIHAKRI